MEQLQYFFTSIGDAINGALQAIVGFLNVVIAALPNPDPFPTIIDSLDPDTAANLAFGYFWIDSFFGIDVCILILNLWISLMINAAIFAFVYFIVKVIKP